VVLERQGDAIRFHPTLLDLAAHYHFEPRAAAVARGNEKGRVERAIRYIRDNFFAGRQWNTLYELNAQADAWCLGISSDRRCPENYEMTVREAFEQERPHLLPLPDNPFDTRECQQVRAAKTPYVRFDLNDYSIPHALVKSTLTVSACLKKVRIIDGNKEVAGHQRSFSKGEQIEDEKHINALWLAKTNAKEHRGQHRISHACEQASLFLQQSIERGHVLKATLRKLNQLLDDYGQHEFAQAMVEAMNKQVPYCEAMQQILERRRDEKQQPPPIAVTLPDKVKGYSVKAAKLSDYDRLSHSGDDDED